MLEIKEGLYSVGVQNRDLRVFDIIMQTPRGTSYNAFLVKGESKAALVETVKDGFGDAYFNNIEEIMPISQIDYLIINHTEPDHAGTIPKLLQKNPNMQVVGDSSAITFITHIINEKFNSRVVKKGDTLDLGGRELSFYPMPNLHWPDTMFTFDSKTHALFTCDFMGAHYSLDHLLLSQNENKQQYLEALKQYYLDIMSPFSQPFVENGIKAVKELKPSIILTGHGALLDTMIGEATTLYEQLAQKPEKNGKSVAIVYVSAYGYTRMLADAIAEELKTLRLGVKEIELNAQNKDKALEAIQESDGVLFGSPTFLGDMLQPIGELLAAIHPYLVKGKLASAFGSYGWSGEGVGNIITRLDQLKVKTIEGYRARLRPSEEELNGARVFARSFADAM